MSYQQWTENGFGFELWTGHNSKDIVEFICAHESSLTDSVKEKLRSCDDEYDVCEELGQFASGEIACIINEAEGTTVFRGFDPCGDTDQYEMIGVGEFHPWDLITEKDREMSRDDAEEILLKYMKILKVDGKPDYFEAHYGG